MKFLRTALIAASMATCFVVSTTAQKHEEILADNAGQYLRNGEWAKAAKAFEMITQRQPSNVGAWFQMGFALHSMGEYDKAIESYNTVVGFGPTALTQVAMYNLGCAYAVKGERDTALDWLEKAAAAGFNRPEQMTSDDDLASLRNTDRFAAVLASVDRNARPCAYEEGGDGLDFWIGDWNVFAPGGTPAGTNRIERVLEDCVIVEHWSGASGVDGRSFSTYDPSTDRWHQTWVDNKGNTRLFSGTKTDSAIVFVRSSTDSRGNVTLTRMTLAPMGDGRVHQLGENSTDGGSSWTTAYDLTYVPKNEDGSGS